MAHDNGGESGMLHRFGEVAIAIFGSTGAVRNEGKRSTRACVRVGLVDEQRSCVPVLTRGRHGLLSVQVENERKDENEEGDENKRRGESDSFHSGSCPFGDFLSGRINTQNTGSTRAIYGFVFEKSIKVDETL
jgi:hypothetical protein